MMAGEMALATRLAISWIPAIFWMAVSSILLTVPSEIQAFLPQFIIFLVTAAVGLYLTTWGARMMKKLRFTRGILAYSGIFTLATAVVALTVRWGSRLQVADPTFGFKMAYASGVIGMGVYSLIAWGKIRI